MASSRFSLSPRKKKLCFTYSFSPERALRSKVALAAAAACASGEPFELLAIPSEADVAAAGRGGGSGEDDDASAPGFQRDRPLRMTVRSVDLAAGTAVLEAKPGPPQVSDLLPPPPSCGCT